MPERVPNEPLKDSQQEMFCQNVANGTMSNAEAYRKAGYSHKGADANSARLMTKGVIRERIQELRGDTLSRWEGATDIIVQFLLDTIGCDITQFKTLAADGVWFEVGPETKNRHLIQDMWSRTSEDGSVIAGVKIADKMKAAQLLAKILGLESPTKVNLTVSKKPDVEADPNDLPPSMPNSMQPRVVSAEN